MLRNLLFYRWLLFNGVVLAGIASVWPQGILQELYTTDTTGITWGITALFVLAWLWTLKEVAVLCHDLNENARLGGSEPAWAFERDKDIAKVQWLAFISVGLVTLGLMGTFIGLKMAVAIDGGTLSSAAGAKQWAHRSWPASTSQSTPRFSAPAWHSGTMSTSESSERPCRASGPTGLPRTRA